MKKLLARIMLPLSVVVMCTAASADSRTLEVWSCSLNEGQTMDDVKAENRNWLGYVNRSVTDGGIQSYVVTPLVGDHRTFMYVDSFPSMAAWVATKDALAKEEGVAIEEALGKLATCTSNSLHSAEEA